MRPSVLLPARCLVVALSILVFVTSLKANDPADSTTAAPAATAQDARPADKAAAGKKAPQTKAIAKKDAAKKNVAAKKDDAVDFPRRIVLIAGPKDEHHGPGTHEYEATVRAIAEALNGSNVADRIEVATFTNGWPEDAAALDEADTIFLTSAGADRQESLHPFLVENRLKVLEKQMDRGCGLVMLHWSLFVPTKYEKQFTRWIGGYFDYQRGDDPRGWHSRITFAKAKILPNQKHPVGKGVPAFEHRDEYYYRIRFGENDKRVTPVVTVTLPEVEEPQVVAWAVERKDGGRSFAFTGGHFQKSWEEDNFRTLLLNAVCWTAKVPIPAGGVHKELAFDDLWTPKPHLGKEDLPKEKEADWVDGRIRESDVGPFYTTSIVAPDAVDLTNMPAAPRDDRKLPINPRMVTKALAVKVGGPDGVPPATVLFDKELMTLRCGWTDGFLNFSDRRFGLLEKPTIEGTVAFTSTKESWQTGAGDAAAPVSAEDREWRGLHRHGDKIVLSYTIAGREIREVNSTEGDKQNWAFTRTIEVGPGTQSLVLTLAQLPDGTIDGTSASSPVAMLTAGDKSLFAASTVTPDAHAALTAHGDHLLLSFPARDEPVSVKVLLRAGQPGDLDAFADLVASATPPAALEPLTHAGPPVWGVPLVTKGQIGTAKPGSPFAVDTVTLPYENPYKALFYAGGFDFAPDGACYLCTAHGDVWKATGIDDDLDQITWQRFATGLYEPLGLKIRDGEVFVLGRDQITRLHDTNADGEADFYENFNDDLTDHGQAHAYAMCLETDAEGNFYFIKSGAPDTPHGGTLLKVSADGKNLDVYATGYRHTNGLGIGPDGTITTADNEGNWTPVTRVDIVEQGEFCGHVPTAHLDPEPTDPGKPLCWLPRVVDNSAGGQAWVPADHWGPLAGSLLHLSYGRCTANLILKEQVNGVWQGGAVVLPTAKFLSGVCRGRFRTSGDGADGHLYVCGLDGWSTEARSEGCLQRVRYVGGPLLIPIGLHIRTDSIELVFTEPLDRELATDPTRYAVNAWTYRWSKDYGSKDYSVADPTQEGRDALTVKSATLSADGRRVVIEVEGLQPVMQLRVQAGLKTAAGAELPVDYYGTIHELTAASGTDQAGAVDGADAAGAN